MSSDHTSDAQFSINRDLETSNRQSLLLRPEIGLQENSGTQRSITTQYTLRSKKKSLFEAISSFDINKLKPILQRIELQDSLTITELYDDDGHNLLHRAAYDNNCRITEFLITYYKQRLAQHLKAKQIEKYGKQSSE